MHMKNNSNVELSELDLKNLGKFIRAKRKEMGLTQQDLAEKISISSQHYSRIENGEYIPSLQTFLKLANLLKFDISNLNLGNGKNLSTVTCEIISLLENFNLTQQKAVLTFLQTMNV